MHVQVPDVPLRTLINEIHSQEKTGRVSKNTLLDFVTCYLSNRSHPKEDLAEASIIGAKYGFIKFMDPNKRVRCYMLIQNERLLPYLFKCSICGRRLTAEESVKRGMGEVCYGKFLMANEEENAKLKMKLQRIVDEANRENVGKQPIPTLLGRPLGGA